MVENDSPAPHSAVPGLWRRGRDGGRMALLDEQTGISNLMGCNELVALLEDFTIGRHIWNVETFLGATGIGNVKRCANQVQPAVQKQHLLLRSPARIVIVVSPGIRTTGESTSEMPADSPGREATYQLLKPRCKKTWSVCLGWAWTARRCLFSVQHHVQGKVESLRGPGEGLLESRWLAQTDTESRMTAERRSGGSILFHFSEQHCVLLWVYSLTDKCIFGFGSRPMQHGICGNLSLLYVSSHCFISPQHPIRKRCIVT